MFAEIEFLLSECVYLFSKVRRLALSVGIAPTPRWFKDEIGTTEHNIRRIVALGEDDPGTACRLLLEVKARLLELEERLRTDGGGENPDGAAERELPPRRRSKRRGRDLFD